MESPAAKRCRPNERYCMHCNEVVAYKTYRAHKRLFYSPTTDTWFCNEAPPEAPQTSGEVESIDENDSSPNSSEIEFEDFNEDSPPCSNPALSESEISYSSHSELSDQGIVS